VSITNSINININIIINGHDVVSAFCDHNKSQVHAVIAEHH